MTRFEGFVRFEGFLVGFFACLLLSVPGESRAQTPTPPAALTTPASGDNHPLRVFLDCYECDEEYLRQNVAFIDYMRDRADADLHILVTTLRTGSGGQAWTVKFIGLGRFRAQDRTLTFTTPQTATSDDRRKEFARVFKLGLIGYAADTSAAPELELQWRPPAQPKPGAARRDPWDSWVFRLGGNGGASGEKTSTFRSYGVNASGNRTTANWKININSNANDNRSTFVVSDEQTVRSSRSSSNLNALAVKSIGPRFSVGARAGTSRSSFSNIDRSYNVSPAFEFNFFPYSQFERRALTLRYTAGGVRYTYSELTVYDKLQETVPTHSLLAMLSLRQEWGSLEVESDFGQQLNRMPRYHASIFGGAEIRLFKGFSFDIFGEYEKIKDRISLRKGTASTEDVLLELRQLSTNYSYFVSFGFSYSFGSIFNNVVNPRFGGGGPFFFFF